ncbi:hypothetical protein DFJ73DRAFT_963541 [Zopfochytrium polystomum]|nr:hypothetical protein DFJ73DRAFT_963541 [Zopfochytrium polystomum]
MARRALRRDWCASSAAGAGGDLGYSAAVDAALRAAAQHNHVTVLEWWWTTTALPPALRPDRGSCAKAIYAGALHGGAVAVLAWCKTAHGRSPLIGVDIDGAAMRAAAALDRVEALRWLEAEAGDAAARRVARLDFSDDAMQLGQLRRRVAAEEEREREEEEDGDEAVRVELRAAAEHAAAHGQVKVLEWIKGATGGGGGGVLDAERVAKVASERGRVGVLAWWQKTYPSSAWRPQPPDILSAVADGHVGVLQFWWELGVDAGVWSEPFLLAAAQGGFVGVFRWWAERFPAPGARCASVVIEAAVQGERFELLDWFKASGYVRPLRCPVTVAARKQGSLSWWLRNGLPLVNDIANPHAFIWKHALNRALMEWLVETRDKDGSGAWSSIPADEDWPRPDLLQIVAKEALYDARSGLLREGALDALEWWRARGAKLGSVESVPYPYYSLIEGHLPFLEWLAARRVGIPLFVKDDESVGSSDSARWWEEAKHRFPASAFVR